MYVDLKGKVFRGLEPQCKPQILRPRKVKGKMGGTRLYTREVPNEEQWTRTTTELTIDLFSKQA